MSIRRYSVCGDVTAYIDVYGKYVLAAESDKIISDLKTRLNDLESYKHTAEYVLTLEQRLAAITMRCEELESVNANYQELSKHIIENHRSFSPIGGYQPQTLPCYVGKNGTPPVSP